MAGVGARDAHLGDQDGADQALELGPLLAHVASELGPGLSLPSTRPASAPVARGSLEGIPSAQRAASTPKTRASRASGSTP